MALDFFEEQQGLIVELSGNVLHYDNQPQINDLLEAVRKAEKVSFAATRLEGWDSTLVSVLYQIALAVRDARFVDWNGVPDNARRLLGLALAVHRAPEQQKREKESFLENLGGKGLSIFDSVLKVCSFLKEVFCSFGRLMRGRAVVRNVDFWFVLEDCSYKAIGIVSLVSFMVGLILAFVGALQLKVFGAQIYIASLVVIGMTRIMGAIMVGIIMAGRTGASYAATIGTMQVNEEIDALKTLGISVTDFLVLPRLTGLILTMPFLTLLADAMGIVGGAFVAILALDVSAAQYWQYSVEAFRLAHFFVGVFHGFVYGIIVALCGCYQGITCGRNADSVGVATTKAVVDSIVIMIAVTGGLTLIFQMLGL